jgi:hypothetical protein
VIITPALGFIAGGLNWINLYGDGEINWTKGFAYVAIIQNFSQLAALYCLVWFYVRHFLSLSFLSIFLNDSSVNLARLISALL